MFSSFFFDDFVSRLFTEELSHILFALHSIYFSWIVQVSLLSLSFVGGGYMIRRYIRKSIVGPITSQPCKDIQHDVKSDSILPNGGVRHRTTALHAQEDLSDRGSDSDDFESAKISNSKLDSYQEHKMVLLIRQDLEMTKGKIAAQCCHAALAAYKYMQKHQPSLLTRWEVSGQPKVTLKVKDEKEMLELITKAQEAGLCAKSIKDAGRTQIAPGSRTVASIGPGPVTLIDYITGHLKLY
jgi:PTH2 family peptidyl-tRNA hydrolase